MPQKDTTHRCHGCHAQMQHTDTTQGCHTDARHRSCHASMHRTVCRADITVKNCRLCGLQEHKVKDDLLAVMEKVKQASVFFADTTLTCSVSNDQPASSQLSNDQHSPNYRMTSILPILLLFSDASILDVVERAQPSV